MRSLLTSQKLKLCIFRLLLYHACTYVRIMYTECASVNKLSRPCSILVTQLRCEAHCDVQHNELVLLEMDGKLDKGELDARGGVIAGIILMRGAQAHSEWRPCSFVVNTYICLKRTSMFISKAVRDCILIVVLLLQHAVCIIILYVHAIVANSAL